MDFAAAWLPAFVLTLACELPVYALVLRRCYSVWWAPLAVALLVNVATHPAFSLWVLSTEPTQREIVIAEGVIALVESGLVFVVLGRNRSWARALLAGVLANLLSFGAGALLYGSGA